MAVKRISLRLTELSENVQAALRLLREARDRIRYVRLVIEQSGAIPAPGETGDPADYEAIMTLFGVPPDGDPQELFTLLLAVDAAVNSAPVDEAIGRIG